MNRILLLLALVCTGVTVSAQPGTPLRFGTRGVARLDNGNNTGAPAFAHLANAIAYSPDGKLYTTAEINANGVIARWNADGTLDVTYGNNGYSEAVRMNFPKGYLQADGKMIMAGYCNSGLSSLEFAVARFNPDGRLDRSFGNGGMVATSLSNTIDWIWDGLVQPDGKFLAAGSANENNAGLGDFALARYLHNGSLDPNFGSGGKVVFSIGAGSDRIYGITRQPDGKILATGFSVSAGNNVDFVLARFLSNGAPDTSFNGTGYRVLNAAGEQAGETIAVQDDGKILVGGYSHNGTHWEATVWRFHADGSTDNGFNGSGKSVLPFPAVDAELVSLRLQPDGKIIGVADVATTSANHDIGLFRLQANGTTDNSFNGTGVRVVSNPNEERFNLTSRNMLLQPDGRVVTFGFEYVGTPSSTARTQMELRRFNDDGSNDNSFGSSGKATAFVNQGTTRFQSNVVRQPDGKLLVAGLWNGSATTAINNDFLVARYLRNGSPDSSFGTNGRVVYTFGSLTESANAILLQPDGKIVVGGTANVTATNTDFALVRLQANGSVDNSFGSGGKLLVSFNSNVETINTLALQPDGKILAGGFAGFPGVTGNDIAIARINPNGTLDNSFGTSGKFLRAHSSGTGADAVSTLALQPDGKILVGGTYTAGFQKGALLRLTAAGAMDNSFNGTGWVALGWSSAPPEFVNGILPLSDGRIVVGGYVNGNSSLGIIAQMAAARLNADGSFDNTFNGTGKTMFTSGGKPSQTAAIALQADGKYVLGGQSFREFSNSVFTLARLLPNGTLDPEFNGGSLLVKAADGDQTMRGMVLHNNEAYVAGFGNHPGPVGVIAGVSLGALDLPVVVSVNGGTYCAGSTMTIQYKTFQPFNAGNTFTVHLSDAAGSFAAPLALRTVSDTGSGTTYALIPAAVPNGDGYRVRIVASDPAYTSADNGTDIRINAQATVNPVGNPVYCAGVATAPVSFTGTGDSYTWTNSNPAIGLPASGTGDLPSFTTVNGGMQPEYAMIEVTPVTAAGCTAKPATFRIAVFAVPAVDAVADQFLCRGNASAPVTFSGPVSGTRYYWQNSSTQTGLAALRGVGSVPSFVAANPTAGPIASTITVTPVGPGKCPGAPVTYQYGVGNCITATGGGGSDAGNARTATLQVSPNPARDLVRLTFTGAAGRHTVDVRDEYGTVLIAPRAFTGPVMTLNLGILRPGAYYVRVLEGSTGAVYYRKVVKL
ncbi:hypothetical protein [Flaviaesturariibacter amylovorans]|uniref:T9SS type A sorting domain-containing protein n=1 Tax=Flaviaesturariibacter amylovorans TaxID=1084520 RepID=A0ABP8HHJ4_9BACT